MTEKTTEQDIDLNNVQDVNETDAVDAEGVEPSATPPLSEDIDSDVQTEVEILRGELTKAQAELTNLQQQNEEHKNKYLRARADLENYRRRAAQDVERAREAGVDSALLSVMNVYDDLNRALKVADENDPSKIIPGVASVRDSLVRNLDTMGIKPVGAVGDTFDPDVHEALTSMPTEDEEKSGTIADVFQVGFIKGERLIRPARVVVYQN